MPFVGALIAISPATFSPGLLLHALRIRPPRSEATKRIKKIKNKILAIPAEAAAIPPKPKTAAINATTRKISVQRNMGDLLAPNSIPTIQDATMVPSRGRSNNPRSGVFWIAEIPDFQNCFHFNDFEGF
jgi:hypothetical protein